MIKRTWLVRIIKSKNLKEILLHGLGVIFYSWFVIDI